MNDDTPPNLSLAAESGSLVTQLERELLQAIIEGRIHLGTRISEAEYARQFGVSRAPLREAARRLEQRGLLIAHPNRGFFVRQYNLQEIDDLYGLRITLERYAASAAAQSASTAELGRLAGQLSRMSDAAKSGDRYTVVAEDIAFHQLLCSLSGNQRLRRMFDDLAIDLTILISRLDDLDINPNIVVESHAEFLAAMLARNAEAAADAIDSHIRGAWVEMRQSIDKLSIGQENSKATFTPATRHTRGAE